MLLLDVNGACRMDSPIDFFDVADGDNEQEFNANNFEYEMSDFESECDSKTQLLASVYRTFSLAI